MAQIEEDGFGFAPSDTDPARPSCGSAREYARRDWLKASPTGRFITSVTKALVSRWGGISSRQAERTREAVFSDNAMEQQ
ncbi:MAG TPA: hypothetical protein PKB10_08380 [Tepidisphaeraceae bacterium]|nr:hypothetical protein [Tepidisphaeraceae bacterium]